MANQTQNRARVSAEPQVGDTGKVGSSGAAEVIRKWKGMGVDRHAPQTTYLGVKFANGRQSTVPVSDFSKFR